MYPGYLNLVVIGGGHMGGAVVRAAFNGRLHTDDRIRVAEPDARKRDEFRREYGSGVEVHESTPEALAGAGMGARVVLAVKPQVFPSVAREIIDGGTLRDQLFISIMAGVRAATVQALFGGGRGEGSGARIVRAMPNLALARGSGMTAVCGGPGALREDVAFAEELFQLGGQVVRIEEGLFEAFTAVAGSGPAYLFLLAEAMARGAVEAGFGAAEAEHIVRQTIVGAAAMLSEGHQPPASLRAAVTSKGGTTEAALRVLDGAGVGESVVRAVIAARDRGREIAAALDQGAAGG